MFSALEIIFFNIENNILNMRIRSSAKKFFSRIKSVKDDPTQVLLYYFCKYCFKLLTSDFIQSQFRRMYKS